MADLEPLRAELSSTYTLEAEDGVTSLGPRFAASAADGARVQLLVLDAAVTAMLTDRDAFVRALEASARVRHAALVPLAGAGISPSGVLHVALAASSLTPARARVAGGQTMSAHEISATGHSLAAACAALHGAGLVHGAITPDWILAGPEGEAQLGGAGLVSALIAAGLPPRRAIDLVGAPQYVSPEVRAGSPLSPAGDIYSLGASLYELHTGKAPFGGRTTAFVMASVLGDETTTVSETGSQYPGQVVDALLRAIEQKPEDRWPDAHAFARALSPAGTPPRGASLPPAKRRWWAPWE